MRYRVDGALYEKATYSTKLLPALSARIKIIGGMDITEKRKPQDGRITQVVNRQEYDIRVSVIPTIFGENRYAFSSQKFLWQEEGAAGAECQGYEDI